MLLKLVYFSSKIGIVSSKVCLKVIPHLQYHENMHFILPTLILRLYTGCRLDQTLSKCIASLKKIKVLKCKGYNCSSFPKPYRIPSAHAYEIHLNCDNCHGKMKIVPFGLFLDASPPRPKIPFTYVVNVYSDMSLSKGHLGSRGERNMKHYFGTTSAHSTVPVK